MALCEFVVEGRGQFPLMMLRYDKCWPARDQDVIALAPHHRGAVLTGESRQVMLVGLHEPTKDRWESFDGGWQVVSGSVRKRN